MHTEICGDPPKPISQINSKKLKRPSTWKSIPRPKGVLWLDKNENLDPELFAFNISLLGQVDHLSLATYPESAMLYQKIADWCGVSPECLFLTPGSDGAIRLVFNAYVESGQSVVHTAPTFAMYPVYSQMFGAQSFPIGYRLTDNGPTLTVNEVMTHIEAVRPRLFCLPNPDSPTGTVFDPGEMRAILKTCERLGTVFLVDEAYHPFYQESIIPLVNSHPNLFVARSFSKAWGLAGLRLGYLVGHPDVMSSVHKLRPMYEVGALSIAVMDLAIDHVDKMEASVKRLEEGRKYFKNAMHTLGFQTLKTWGNFQHVRFGDAADQIHKRLEHTVLYRKDFDEACLQGFSRFSLTTRHNFKKIISVID